MMDIKDLVSRSLRRYGDSASPKDSLILIKVCYQKLVINDAS